MILCAGLGTRLLPITEKSPKPLVPVLNVPNLIHTVTLLKRAGIEDIVVNLYHLPQLIEQYLGDGRKWGVRFHFSRESVLLGTGGGLKKAESFFSGEPFVLANCDFITNIDLRPLIAQHRERGATATMILLEDETLQPLYSKVGIDRDGYLCSLPSSQTRSPARTGIFTGIHILENETLRYLKAIPSGINEILYPALMKESPTRVFGQFVENTYWCDTGDLNTFWSTSMKLLGRLADGDSNLKDLLSATGAYVERKPGIWSPEGHNLPNGVELIAPVIIGRDCDIGAGSKIGPFAVLGDGTRVGAGARLSNFVGLGAAQIPPKGVSEGALQFHSEVLPLKKDPTR